MKTGFLVLLSLLLLIFPAAVFAVAPKVVPVDKDFNFGQVFQGTKVEHTFRFKNAGDAPLTVEKVRSSCGCTAAMPSANLIPPGGTGEIRTTFDSTRFRGDVEKTVYLYVNDPAQSVVQFHVRGAVKPEMLMEPEQIDLGQMVPGASKAAQVVLTSQGEEAISLSLPETTSSELSAEISSRDLSPGNSVKLTVKAIPREGQTRLTGYVLIKTSSPRVPQLRLPVFGNVGEPPTGR